MQTDGSDSANAGTADDAGRRPRVALFVETSISFGRGVLRGIARYLHEQGPWSVFVEQRELGAALPTWIERWDGDGVITRSDDARILYASVPTVGLYDRSHGDLGIPMIVNDNRAVGLLAGRHLVKRGFRHFGWYGPDDEYWAASRLEGLVDAVRGKCDEPIARFTRRLTPRQRHQSWESHQDALSQWVRGLPKPAGLVACNDVHGLRALDACRRAGVAVPEEVAVVGADNDAELCELSDPPLTSVAFNPEHVGYEAAVLLDRMMRGSAGDAEVSERLIAPRGVVTRRSTDVLAIEDPIVAQALHHIRRHACAGITVEQVLNAVPVSRRTLEKRFQQLLGRTPKAEIEQVRMERAKALLAETSLAVTQVCFQAGFQKAAYFSSAFRRVVGMTPSAYRRQFATADEA